MAWDGGITPSKALTLARTPDGTLRATLGVGESAVAASRVP
jgi:hypothetical protein